jgi:3-hydroxybutyryl-CoA dehydrogenase
MGPFALLDIVGLDTSVAILDALHAEFKDDNYVVTPSLRKLVSEGKLGRKTKQGFFSY